MSISRFFGDKFILSYDKKKRSFYTNSGLFPATGGKCIEVPLAQAITCTARNGAVTIMFDMNNKKFYRSILSHKEDDISVSYGICDKF